MSKDTKEEFKSEIEQVANKLFLQYGLRSVSIDDICQERHISKKTFYQYFPSKEALIETLVLDRIKFCANQVYNQCKKKSGKMNDAIDVFMSLRNMPILKPTPQQGKFLYDLGKYYPDIAFKRADVTFEEYQSLVIYLLEEGIQEGLFREDLNLELTARIITIHYMASVPHILDKCETAVKKEALKTLTDLEMRSLCNEKGLACYYQKLEENEKNESIDNNK